MKNQANTDRVNRRQFLETILAGGIGLVLTGCTSSRENQTETQKYTFNDLKRILGKRWTSLSYDEKRNAEEFWTNYDPELVKFMVKVYSNPREYKSLTKEEKQEIKRTIESPSRLYNQNFPWIKSNNIKPEDRRVITVIEDISAGLTP